jgi:hypothetical protein
VRSLRAVNGAATIAAATLIAVAIDARPSAHRRDEYLQAARVAVEPTRVDVELDLTPGIAAAESLIAAIDSDGDGAFSPEEQRDYTAQVLSAVDVQADGRPLTLEPAAWRFPDLAVLRRGEGTIQFRSAIALRSSAGAHSVLLRNAYRPEVSVYMANAMVPDSDRVSVTAQHRDPEQRELTVDYVVDAKRAAQAMWPLLAGIIAATIAAAATLGARHQRPC